MSRTQYCIFETPAGFCGMAWTGRGISRFQLPATTADGAERLLLRRTAGATPSGPTPEVRETIDAVRRYFAGEKIDFAGVTLDLEGQDSFSREIYGATRRLGWGETTTYGALARFLDRGPEAARDVGQAMAKNPVPLIIPCHRVLAAGGRLGGFSAPGGADTKRRMLEMEGVQLPPSAPVQQELGL